jgi:polyhydroxybutyrate depolymerase
MLWALTVTVLLAGGGDALPAGTHRRTLRVDGRLREYLVHVPVRDDASRPLPVVLAFHGGGRNAEHMIWLTGLNETADTCGFLAVYPQGSGVCHGLRTWNAGDCCAYAARHQIDDVRWVEQLLDDLARLFPVDTQRIYATGISNGAMLCYLLAIRLPDRLAAIAPVAGTLATSLRPSVPSVSVIHFHGTEDRNVPYDGGTGSRSLTKHCNTSVAETIRTWVQANQCQTDPTVECMSNLVRDGTSVTRTAYQGGSAGAEVVLYTIGGGGHTWPGGRPTGWYFGRTTRNIAANQLIWEFFERHRLLHRRS